MKQPKNRIEIYPLSKFESGATRNEYWVELYLEEGGSAVDLGVGLTPESAIKAAIRRLDRLQRDCVNVLAKFQEENHG